MAKQNPLEEIEKLLQHEYIRERRRGVQKAAGLLAQDLYRDQLRAMLAGIARSDLSTNLVDFTRKVLDEDDRRHKKSPPQSQNSSPDYIVGAVCPKGHPNYYDKRIICKGEVHYRELLEDGSTMDAIVVKCQTQGCGEEMKIMVDCEGYK